MSSHLRVNCLIVSECVNLCLQLHISAYSVISHRDTMVVYQKLCHIACTKQVMFFYRSCVEYITFLCVIYLYCRYFEKSTELHCTE